MPTAATDIQTGATDYRLNLLGVRVWRNTCQLVARNGVKWLPIGPRWQLPVYLDAYIDAPGPAQSLSMTVSQFCTDWPEAGLAEILHHDAGADNGVRKRRWKPSGHSPEKEERNARLIELSQKLLRHSRDLVSGNPD